MITWTKVADRRPERGQKVTWIGPDGEEVEGTFQGVWMLPDGVYVY